MDENRIATIIKNNFRHISEEYKQFCSEKLRCRLPDCSLFEHYRQIVPSEGNALNPVYMMIGEGPGADEVSQVRPFVGRAGKRLRESLRKIGFTKDNTLISNILPCRPLNNKFPTDKMAVHNCKNRWLDREVKIVKPKIIVLLGGQALRLLLGRVGITKERGRWVNLPIFDIACFPTYHPSYVIRCENTDDGDKVSKEFDDDLREVRTTAITKGWDRT